LGLFLRLNKPKFKGLARAFKTAQVSVSQRKNKASQKETNQQQNIILMNNIILVLVFLIALVKAITNPIFLD